MPSPPVGGGGVCGRAGRLGLASGVTVAGGLVLAGGPTGRLALAAATQSVRERTQRRRQFDDGGNRKSLSRPSGGQKSGNSVKNGSHYISFGPFLI